MSTKAPTLRAFHERFPTEDSCLDHLMRTRFGERFVCFKCLKESRYYRVKGRRCFECERCGYQVYPTAGTPFEKTRTSLRDWFLVMFLFTTSRNGVAAKEVQRQIGVTYKTAWRMCREIRKYMGYVDGDHTLGGSSGVVEVDHAFVGGKDRIGENDKAVVLGMIERGGDVITRVVPVPDHFEATPHIYKFVTKSAQVMTDDARAFRAACAIYKHQTVDHSAHEYVRGDVHTNNIEAFWAIVKRSIAGTYISVSKKHLQKYLWEFEFRQNLRKVPHLMFDLLLASFPKVRVEP
jgi:transposase